MLGAQSLQIESIGALIFGWSMIPRVKPEGMLFGKPVSTPDHALSGSGAKTARRRLDDLRSGRGDAHDRKAALIGPIGAEAE